MFSRIAFGYIKNMRIFLMFFIVTILVPSRTHYYNGLYHYRLGFPLNSIIVFSDTGNLGNWDLLFNGNCGVGVNIIQFLLNLFLVYVIIDSFDKFLHCKKLQKVQG